MLVSFGWKALAILAAWEMGVRVAGVRPDILPGPSRIALEIFEQGLKLRDSGLTTGSEALTGLLIAMLVGIPLGGFVARHARLSRYLSPMLSLMRRTPLVALAPVGIVWFGFGYASSAFTAAVLAFLPVLYGTENGLRSVPQEASELMRTMGASPVQSFIRLELPASLPFFFAGLKSAVTFAVIGALAGEYVGSETGLGYLMLVSGSRMETPLLFAALTIVVIMTLALQAAIVLLENYLITGTFEVFTGTAADRDVNREAPEFLH